MKGEFTTTLDLGAFGEVEVKLEYNAYPGRPAVMYLSNGDPGYPEEPAEVEFLKCTTVTDGVDLTKLLNRAPEATIGALEEELWETLEDRRRDAEEDRAAEATYDRRGY